MQCAQCIQVSYAHAYMYDVVYSARTPVPTHHKQLYFVIESGRRTLILIQYTIHIYPSIYLLIVTTDTCTVTLPCRVTVLTLILLLILTLSH